MTFIAPKTWAVGEVLSAVDMNLYVRDNTEDLDNRVTGITDGDFSFRYAGSRVYTTTGKFNRDDAFGNGIDTSWIRYVHGKMVGGGGSGSPGDSTQTKSVGGGGGAGAYVEFFYPYSFFLEDGDVEIGAGGIGATTGPGGEGSATRFQLTFGFLAAGGGRRGDTSPLSQTVDNRQARGGDGGTVAGTSAGFLSFTPYRFVNGQRGGPGTNGFSVVHAGDDLIMPGNGGSSMLGQGPTGTVQNVSPVTYRPGGGYGFGGAAGFEAVIPGDSGADGVVFLDFYR